MEEHSCYKNIDFDSPKNKELLRRFQKLTNNEKTSLLKSICQNGTNNFENSHETLETILSLLNKDGLDTIQDLKNFTDVFEDEAEEEEEEDEEEDCDEAESDEITGDKRKYILTSPYNC
jgi:Ran GTPase-activating protein (RanGAP) involved in mRNA processing and transport